ncbi:hypothetical protein BO83DRAFT_4596 [Aspergillus eucalypticola CBS 122712]|uniref:Uncharacterized protein n=1 Tax=Aspergillus eucalypticola (strain CBS 122712 / IBT 29274) TaxID=1448314 RepID=A0A317WM46_ASPEC|nr:uncharacterized protein BO83DRAFT_4596 [Aspergillus eucalypticola CBS 122712]PWY85310.1 hypothetical protein BO83DRAFT_4596 [Aspergillus eucalypticola CBS 122712]
MPRNYCRKEGDKAGMYLEDIGALHNNDKLIVEQNHEAAHHNYARHEGRGGDGVVGDEREGLQCQLRREACHRDEAEEEEEAS